MIREGSGFGGAPLLPEAAVEKTIRNLYIQSLRAKLELCRITGAALMRELESPMLTVKAKREVFYRWFDVTRDGDILGFVLELVRRSEREARGLQP